MRVFRIIIAIFTIGLQRVGEENLDTNSVGLIILRLMAILATSIVLAYEWVILSRKRQKDRMEFVAFAVLLLCVFIFSVEYSTIMSLVLSLF